MWRAAGWTKPAGCCIRSRMLNPNDRDPSRASRPPERRRRCSLAARVASYCISALLAMMQQGCAQTQIQGNASGAEKRVVIDKTKQTLFAYEGERLVLQSRVSTGRAGRRTPSGNFTAGIKLRMHYSRLYNNAPMPWSVQVNGNFFIHGFTSVPDHPASHGCIRLPLDADNPAKRFFDWVEPGIPIVIEGEWEGKPRR